MLNSVWAMFSRIVDYAGMFPPAQLPLEEAIRNHARYRNEPESWMLGRFVCPAARLQELSPFIDELFSDGPSLAISVLGRSGRSGSDFLADFRADLKCVSAFRQRHGERVKVDVYETRVPPERTAVLLPISSRHHWLVVLGETLDALGPPRVRLFLEANLPNSMNHLMRIISEVNRFCRQTGLRLRSLPFGFKLRCGGTEASAFPSVEQLSSALNTCRDKWLPLKATAGLHHPLRRFDAALGGYSHGFLNLWVAGLAAYEQLRDKGTAISEGEIASILGDEQASNFVFDLEGVRWRNLTIPTLRIAELRCSITSFGSCSFDEPREGLRKLGLIP
jgi:hypothetical protein